MSFKNEGDRASALVQCTGAQAQIMGQQRLHVMIQQNQDFKNCGPHSNTPVATVCQWSVHYSNWTNTFASVCDVSALLQFC